MVQWTILHTFEQIHIKMENVHYNDQLKDSDYSLCDKNKILKIQNNLQFYWIIMQLRNHIISTYIIAPDSPVVIS